MRQHCQLSLISLAILLCLSAARRVGISRKSRDPADFHLNEAEILLGTKMLPDGVEIMSYLYKGVTARYDVLADSCGQHGL